MAKLKSELSVKNRYYIPKHRYYELRHFCLQYPEWRVARNAVGCISSTDISGVSVKQNCSDPVARAAEMRLFYENRMNMIDRIAKETDPSLYSYIFKGVTEGLSYDILRARMDIPCCREVYLSMNMDSVPTIRPVMDLSDIQSGIRVIGSMFSATRGIDVSPMTDSVSSAIPKPNRHDRNAGDDSSDRSQTVLNFNQYNNSPKSLSRIEIYRQTHNIVAAAKEALSKA